MFLRLLHTVSFTLLTVILFCQIIDEKDFVQYNLRQGLSDNYVSGIAQDSNGYMWIATRHGLNRFDGKTFKQFLVKDKYISIPDNVIYLMNTLKDDLLGIATNDGAQVISTKTLRHVNLSIIDDDKLRYWSNTCLSVLNDADGNYGVSSKTGFYIFSPSGQIKNRFDYFTRADIGQWMIFGDDILQLPDGNMMQLNQNGGILYDRKTNKFLDVLIKYPSLKSLVQKHNNVSFLLSNHEFLHINMDANTFDIVDIHSGKTSSSHSAIDLSSNITWTTRPEKINDSMWAINCKVNGFFLITIDTIKKTVRSSPKYFTSKFCTTVFKDRDGKLWIGTNQGLFKQNIRPTFVETFKLDIGKQDINIGALHITKDKIFVGTSEKSILILDKHSKKLIRTLQFPKSPVLSNYIRTFHQLHPDTLWIGASAGFFWLNLRNFSTGSITMDSTLPYQNIFLFFADKKKNVWASNNELSSLYYYDTNKGSFTFISEKNNPLFKTNINSVAEDKAGNIWIGGDAIVRWNRNTQKIDTLIEHIITQQNFKKGFHIMADSKGDIWTTINDDGLAKLTGDQKHLRPNNLTQEKNSYMLPALFNDKIFVYTTKGVGYFDIASSKSVVFTENDGIPSGPTSTAFFENDADDGSVWFAIKDVICKIPALTSGNYLNSPILTITALSVLNDTIINYPSKKIRLNYAQGDLNIFYSAVNYIDPENMQFAYRIKNKKDSSWIEAGDQQNILLTNISPGNYNIQIKVSAFDNKWPEQIKDLEIEIRPPFWKTELFFISMALVLATIAWLLYRYRIRQIKQKAGLDKLIAQTEMKALHAQMNPHFIFNCLNSIREMILNNENEQASLYLSKFARLIRITLNQSSKPFVSLTDTIDYLERYLEMEKIRSGHFSYQINIGEGVQPDEVMMPPMLIQPFIENAIWHGTSSKKNLHVDVSFRKTGHELVCTVEDNGIGIEESLRKKEKIPNQPSVGIENIRQRIGLLNAKYNLQSTVHIEDKLTLPIKNGTGTIVTLHLPIKTNESLWIT